MSSNKKVREQLEKKYGKECFIEKLHLRKDGKPRRYTSKAQMKRMKQLTMHHIKMRKDGGETSVENGALLSRRKSHLVSFTIKAISRLYECNISRV